MTLPCGKPQLRVGSKHREGAVMQFKVTGMTCGHCVAAVTRAVKGVPAVQEVSIDLEQGLVTVTGHADARAVREAIIEEGYEIATG